MRELATDVVVIGFGGAGATAAIEAHDAGASVVILEKTEKGGGSTVISSGSLRLIADTKKAASHFHALAENTTPMSMMEVFAEGAAQIPDWIRSKGGTPQEVPYSELKSIFPHPAKTTSFPHIKDSDGVGGRLRVKPKGKETGGVSLWAMLTDNVASRGITVLYNSPARKLLKDSSGRIAGVRVATGDGEIEIKAKRAVILTCGGFNYNPEMQRQFFGFEMPSVTPPFRNTGDGIRMAQAVGADLWHMNAVAAGFGYKIPGYDAAFQAKFAEPSFFIVDQKGKRYVNETGVESHSGVMAAEVMDPAEGRHDRLPSYLIFDDVMRRNGPIVTQRGSSYNMRFAWSRDNSDAVKQGWIKTGRTMAELATHFTLPPDVLEDSLVRFNRGCDSGEDQFGREPSLIRRLEPPYFGIPIWPAIINTQGGPRRNEKAQVIDVYGDPIPGLYSAGELGSIWGSLYPGAGNVCECIVFGRIAGRNAAAER
jgi:succinate dehydrogenase/fumarate reductase flavoprotein subunit